MPDLKEIAKSPGYDNVASAASKSTIFVFLATFGYLAFFTNTSPGLFGGIAFVTVGIFVISILVAMPLFLLKSKFPKLAAIAVVLNIAITVLLTRFVYLWIFSQTAVLITDESRSFTCSEPLPEFTLSRQSNPSDGEIGKLCTCIYETLNENDREISEAIANGRESDVSATALQRFVPRFGAALRSCGGYEL